MIFTASRGQAFSEAFNFKSANGKAIALPAGDYRLTLERGEVAREGRIVKQRSTILWNMTADETQALEYSTMYFTLTHNGQEIARGVLRVN